MSEHLPLCARYARGYAIKLRRSGGIGRRAGLKIQCPQGRGGSSPLSGTGYELTTSDEDSHRYAVALLELNSRIGGSLGAVFRLHFPCVGC